MDLHPLKIEAIVIILLLHFSLLVCLEMLYRPLSSRQAAFSPDSLPWDAVTAYETISPLLRSIHTPHVRL